MQLRAKQWTQDQRLHAAHALCELARATDTTLLINGDAQLCISVDAHGVQLPSDGPTIADARAMLGLDRWIGASCHDRHELLRAEREGADFALLSPWGEVPGKRLALGHQGFGALALHSRLPVYALGGIGLDQIEDAVTHGASGVAVIRDLHRAHEPARWVQRVLTLLSRAHHLRRSIDKVPPDGEPPT